MIILNPQILFIKFDVFLIKKIPVLQIFFLSTNAERSVCQVCYYIDPVSEQRRRRLSPGGRELAGLVPPETLVSKGDRKQGFAAP